MKSGEFNDKMDLNWNQLSYVIETEYIQFFCPFGCNDEFDKVKIEEI